MVAEEAQGDIQGGRSEGTYEVVMSMYEMRGVYV